ncbi:unnamed protein product [Lathyrus oleraceus]
MADKHNILRHDRVAQHASVRREPSQQVPDAPSTFGQTEPSTSGARASPPVTPSPSSHRRRDSPSDASFPLSYRRHQYSPVSSPTDDAANLVPPPIDDNADPVPPPEGETAADVEPGDFGGGLVDFSLLPLYPYHTARHI